MGTRPGVPQRVLFECFWALSGLKKGQKALKKHSLGQFAAGAQNCSKSTPCGTFRPGPLGTPVNGGRDRKLSMQNHQANPEDKFTEARLESRHGNHGRRTLLQRTANIPLRLTTQLFKRIRNADFGTGTGRKAFFEFFSA